MTKSELAKAAGVSPSTIDRAVRDGFLTPIYDQEGAATVSYDDAQCRAWIDTRNGKFKPSEALQLARQENIGTQVAAMDRFLSELKGIVADTVKAVTESQARPGRVLSLKKASEYTGIPA